MMGAPQIIDLQYDGKRHWFKVWRYATEQDLYSALKSDHIKLDNKDSIAYCDCYPPIVNGKENEEAGRMYFLDKTVETFAHEATHMALGILARHGHKSVVATIDKEPELSHDLCYLIGSITSQLYSQSSAF